MVPQRLLGAKPLLRDQNAINRINVAPIFECFDRDTHAQIEWRDQALQQHSFCSVAASQ